MESIKVRINEIAKKTSTNKSKVDTDVLSDTLYYRLTIMRLGEEDNNAWWESSILSEVGRRNLEKFFPNTFSKQRYGIARKIMSEKEIREIPERKYTTLFNFGYRFETEVFMPFISEISKDDEWQEILYMLEDIKEKKFNSSWVRDFYGISKLPNRNITGQNIIELGSVGEAFYNNKTTFEDTIKSFLSIYDMCTQGNVVIPYYKRRRAI